MNIENQVTKPKTWGRRIAKALLLVSVSVVAVFLIAGFVWRLSGSNHWEFVGEKKGVKVYSLKAPGATLTQVKGVTRVRSSLSGLVKLMQDPEICKDLGCRDSRIVERVDDQLQYSTFRYNLPFRFRPRDFVVRTQVYQNPHTREVLLEFAAAPDKAPPNDCCFRVTDMNNMWRLTPLGNGEIEIEYVQNMNEGGFLPDLMLNMARPKIMFAMLPRMQRLVSREKYRTARFDFIKE